MAKEVFYAVKEGRNPGIYRTWAECETQVKGFSNARFHKFDTEQEAEEFIHPKKKASKTSKKEINTEQTSLVIPDGPFAFVDGSFNTTTKIYGFGGFVYDGEKFHFLCGNGSDPELASMRNVAGEIMGAMAAVSKAEELHLSDLMIFYDYQGIEKWATGLWKAKKQGTKHYVDFMTKKRSVRVKFQKVAAHTGIEGNETADILAKYAVGNSLSKRERDTARAYLPEEKHAEFESISCVV